VAILKFLQLGLPLPPLKPMAQLRRGENQIVEAQMHPLTKVILRFIQIRLAKADQAEEILL
jgi:hypothetical protein